MFYESYVAFFVLAWLCVLTLLLVVELWARSAWQKRRAEEPAARCVACSYDVDGLPRDVARCPECGGALTPGRVVLAHEGESKSLLPDARSTTLLLLVWIVVSLVVLVPRCPPIGTVHIARRIVRIDAPSVGAAHVTIERRRDYRAYYDEGSLPMVSYRAGGFHRVTFTARARGTGIGALRIDEDTAPQEIEDWVERVFPAMTAHERARIEFGIAVYIPGLQDAWPGVEPPETTCVRHTINGAKRTRLSNGRIGFPGIMGTPSLNASAPQHALHFAMYLVAYGPLVWMACTAILRAKKRYVAAEKRLRG